MKTIYKEDTIPNLEELLSLYNDVKWSAYTKNPNKLKKAIDNSLKIITVWEGRQLIGLIRAVGDGETILYIQDILVREKHQRKGIGKRLIQMILSSYPDVRQKILLTDDTEKTRRFYESVGFSACDDGKIIAFAMMG